MAPDKAHLDSPTQYVAPENPLPHGRPQVESSIPAQIVQQVSSSDARSPSLINELTRADNAGISGPLNPEASLEESPARDDLLANSSIVGSLEMSVDGPDFRHHAPAMDGLEIVIEVEREEAGEGYQESLLNDLEGVEISIHIENDDVAGAELISMNEEEGYPMQNGVVCARVDLPVGESGPEVCDDETREPDGELPSEIPAPDDVKQKSDDLECKVFETKTAIINIGDEGFNNDKKRPRERSEETHRISKAKKTGQGAEEFTDTEEVCELEIGGDKYDVKECREVVETAQNGSELQLESSGTFIGSADTNEGKEEVADIATAEKKRTRDSGGPELTTPSVSSSQEEMSRQVKPKIEEVAIGTLQDPNGARSSKDHTVVESDGNCIEETGTSKEDKEDTEGGSTLRTRPRKRRKIAMLLAYCGAGYQGMQKNPGAVTIEGELEGALIKAEAIPDTYDGNPRKVDWMRAARTDKGVSAVGQVVSGLFYVDPPGFVERVNSHLPKQIRLLGYTRVIPTFSAKKYCDRRRYEYVVPVFAFDPSAHRDRESVLASEGKDGALIKCQECSERGRKIPGAVGRGWGRSVSPLMEEKVECATMEDEDKDRKEMGIDKVEEEGGPREELGIVSGVNKEVLKCLETKGFGGGVDNGPSEVPGIGTANGQETVPAITEEKAILTEEEGTEQRDGVGMLHSEKQSCKVPAKGEGEGEESHLILQGQPSPLPESEEKNMPELNLQSDFPGGEKSNCPFHFGEAERTRLNHILSRFVGTHNFHNFTTRMKAEDPSAKRYIVSFEASDIFTVGNVEFVRCTVVGQSFMLHQIRKMIGLAIAIFRGCAPESMLDTALRRDVHVNVPTAPELGLFLDECMYPAYNQKWYNTHEEVSQKGFEEEISLFKHKFIYEHIAATESKDGVMALFLHSLNDRNFPDFVTAREAEKLKAR